MCICTYVGGGETAIDTRRYAQKLEGVLIILLCLCCFKHAGCMQIECARRREDATPSGCGALELYPLLLNNVRSSPPICPLPRCTSCVFRSPHVFEHDDGTKWASAGLELDLQVHPRCSGHRRLVRRASTKGHGRTRRRQPIARCVIRTFRGWTRRAWRVCKVQQHEHLREPSHGCSPRSLRITSSGSLESLAPPRCLLSSCYVHVSSVCRTSS